MKRTVAIVAVVLVVMATGCSGTETTMRKGWAGKSVPGEMTYSFETFDGTESTLLTVDANASTDVEYQTDLSEGTLSIRIETLSGSVNRSILTNETGTTEGRVSVTDLDPGRYKIVVEGDEASGSFSVTW